MIPIEVTWEPASNNSSPREGVWVDTITVQDDHYANRPYVHKAVIVDLERNTINMIPVDKVRTLNRFVSHDYTEPAPALINLPGRRVVTGRPGNE